MKRLVPYIIGLLLAGCVSDDGFETTQPMAVDVAAESVITICGGKPSGTIGAKTRAVNPPSLAGSCLADKMQIWVYTDAGTHYSWQTPSDLTLNETLTPLDVVNTRQNGESTDRWAKRDYTCSFRRAPGTLGTVNGNHFAIPALAYTHVDDAKFSVNTGGDYTALSLSLTADALSASPVQTPELYFGRLRFLTTASALKGYWDDDGGRWNQYGYFYYRNTNSLSGSDNFTNPLSGHLYRIVSQINVSMTEVPTNMVDRLELYMTNVPKTVGLYGIHGNVYGTDGIGRFYPVSAATSVSSCIDGLTLVATTNDFTNEKAHLSAFFLPSEVGGELTLRVYYKAGAVKDASGYDVVSRDYPIRPGKSAFLTGDDADVYHVESPALQNGSNLYVYNTTLNKFYSYANVRVNISGKYENVAAEDQDVTITLEVEPGYERQHTITIN